MKLKDNFFLVPWMTDLGLGETYEELMVHVATHLAQEEELDLDRLELELKSELSQDRMHNAGARSRMDTRMKMDDRLTKGLDMSRRTTQHDWVERVTTGSRSGGPTLSGSRRQPRLASSKSSTD